MDGALRERALKAVAGLAGALAPYAGDAGLGAGLFAGQAGLALAFDALERAGVPSAQGLAERCLDVCLEAAANDPLDASLEAGLAGIGFALERVTGDATASESVDEALLAHLGGPVAPVGPDLLNGLVGYGLYALGRGEMEAALLGEIFRHLESFMVVVGDAVHVRFSASMLPPDEAAKYPDGFERIGLAHGSAGVVSLLALAAPRSRTAARLLAPVTRGLLAAQEPLNHAFPDALSGVRRIKLTDYESWCNGSPGVAAALSLALGGLAPESPLVGEISECIDAVLQGRPVLSDGVLCHGTAGNGQIALRIHQRTPTAETAAAVRHWVEATLALAPHAEGLFGYASHRPWLKDAPWVRDASLGVGAAGVALFLLAACGGEAPAWDRILGLS